jgi:hypothetical protein
MIGRCSGQISIFRVVRLLRVDELTVVSHSAVQTSDQHQTLIQDSVDPLLVGFNSNDTVLGETLRAVSEQSNALEQVLDQDRLEHVEFELTVRSSDRNGSVVSNDLCGDHGQSLALSRVDLSGHDRRTGLVLRERKLSQTTSRSRGEVTNVVGDLHQRDGNGVHGSGSLDDGIVCGQGFKLVVIRYAVEIVRYGRIDKHVDQPCDSR